MRTVRRLRLRFLLFTTLCVVLSTCVLVALSKPSHPHQKYFSMHLIQRCNFNAHWLTKILLVEVEGIEPSSRTPFSLLHTAILTLYSVFIYKANLCLYSNLNFLKPAIQLSRFSINNRGKSLSTPMIIIKLPTGIPVRSSKATAYAAVCIK